MIAIKFLGVKITPGNINHCRNFVGIRFYIYWRARHKMRRNHIGEGSIRGRFCGTVLLGCRLFGECAIGKIGET